LSWRLVALLGSVLVLTLLFVGVTVLAALDYHEDGLEHADCPLCQLSASLHSAQPSPAITVDAIPAVEALGAPPSPAAPGAPTFVRKSARSPPTPVCAV
jgi:hypothetical protein